MLVSLVHIRDPGRPLNELDLHGDADLLKLVRENLCGLHMVHVVRRNLHREGETVRIACLSKQCLRLRLVVRICVLQRLVVVETEGCVNAAADGRAVAAVEHLKNFLLVHCVVHSLAHANVVEGLLRVV